MAIGQILNIEHISGSVQRLSFSVKPRKRRDEGKFSFYAVGVWIGILLAGAILFFHVWWPIQAERALFELRKMEKEVSIKKSELDRLQTQYSEMISLASLEQVAREKGRWVSPSIEHVVIISK